MPKNQQNKLSLFITAMLLGALVSIGIMYSLKLFSFQQPQEFAKLNMFYEVLDQHYVDPIDQSKLVDGAIIGMLQALDDPYTSYMTKQEGEAFTQSIQGEFEGIGAEVREVDGQTMIVAPIKNTPAEKAGLKANDLILEVDGKSVAGMKIEESVALIRGPKGSEVELLIQRDGVEEPFQIVIIRDKIPLESVFTTMLEEEAIAVIQVSKFGETTAREFAEALDEVKAAGATGIVLDLRHNPGGLLHQVVAMSEMFVPKNELILQVRYRDGSADVYRSQKEAKQFPVVVLIDEGSASASEIMAGALKESAGMTLVGKTTFGKGTVQTTKTAQDGSMLKYTMAEWLTPLGNQINKDGIAPDIEVSLPEYANLPFLSSANEFKEGERATEISIAKQYLQVLGYDPGEADGFFTAQTTEAIQSFQAASDLETTGQLDRETARAMTEAISQKIKDNDTQLERAKAVLLEQLNSN